MTEAIDFHLPVSSVISRLENHKAGLQSELDAMPRWQWRRRLMLKGAIGAYAYEIEQTLGIVGGWQPMMRGLGKSKTRS
jgi:hypothetical protein